MTIHVWQGVIIFSAAFVAGMMNSVAGGGTLLTFPALIWMGIDPKAANVTSTIALWPGSLGGMVGYRRELRDSRRFMQWLAPSSVAGGLVGALLLLKTPSSTFAAIVPFLILFATILFAAGEPVMRWLRRQRHDEKRAAPHHPATSAAEPLPPASTEPGRAWWAGAIILQFFSATYGGYFGAGNGIVMLAVLGLLGLTDIHQMNGLKNFFAVCINVIASFYFMIWGPVQWPAALVMTVGAIAGGYGGAGLARRMGRRFARGAVIFIGLAMTLSLLFRR
ncbi:MAG TPA: sulfite exporter TauE/SafE family protein [Blastocatellia bacterium]|nr:sulfite exporter TauE/SafE family protein [Blastocatellia bacterium]